ncbi:MAG: Crp/Fnr family transcriptional regulator [Nitrospirota bacterium]|jgi:CRP-like cAMP-binding protein
MLKLDKISIFEDLSEEDLKEIERFLVPESFGRRNLIFAEGDPSEWFYFVVKGKVKITKLSQDGKEIILEVIGPDEFFGGIAVVRGFPYPANAVAMEDTEAAKISRRDLLKVLERFPELAMKIVQSLGERMKESHEMTKTIALEKVGARIAALLLKLASKSGRESPEGIEIGLRLTKQDIAEMVGTTVETSIRTMSQFKKQGLIEEKEGRIVIKDRAGLEALGL